MLWFKNPSLPYIIKSRNINWGPVRDFTLLDSRLRTTQLFFCKAA